MKVKEAMHKGAEWVEATTPIWTIAKKMRDLDVGAIPVGENDRLIGMVTDRDLTVRVLAEGAESGSLGTVIPAHRGQRSGDCGQNLTNVQA